MGPKRVLHREWSCSPTACWHGRVGMGVGIPCMF